MSFVDNICNSVEKKERNYHAMAPEIVMTSSFYFENFEEYISACENEVSSYVYTRGNNPTTEMLEEKLAALEGGERCKVFGSGMGAIGAALFTLLKSGDHVLLINTVYGTAVSLMKYFHKFGVSYDVVNATDMDTIKDALKENTKVVYFESPSSQKFEMIDLEKIAKVAKEKHIYTVIDNTWATPIFQNPLKYGIDLVIHSCSKYIGGHSDIVCGAIVGSKDIVEDIEKNGYMYLGSTCSPINSYLALRGLRSMPARMRSFDESIKKIINHFSLDKRIKKIHHPYCGDENQKAIANKYLTGYGSLFAIDLADSDIDKLKEFVDRLKVFTLGVSWGGFESLVLPVFKGTNREDLKQRGLDITHIRMYVGLEDPDSLIKDIEKSLDAVYSKV